MQIKEDKAPIGPHVLLAQEAQQGGLARPGFSEDGQVLGTPSVRDDDRLIFPELPVSNTIPEEQVVGGVRSA